MKTRHVFVWLTLLFLLSGIGTSLSIHPAGAQDAPQCEGAYEHAEALLAQRQAALEEGNVILALSLMDQAEDLLAPCVDDTTPTGLFPEGNTPDWTPAQKVAGNAIMVQVPPGCFEMGSDNGSSNEQPGHEICFSLPYWIDKTEVTRGMYAECVEAGDCEPTRESTTSTRATQPINRVTWFQADAYCNWRGLELPTEAEWEYAARGPESLHFPWSDEFIPDNVVYSVNSGDVPADVGSRPSGSSWVGALDMSGNVAEWVGTVYQSYPYQLITGTVEQSRVARGGSYAYSFSSRLSTTARNNYGPTFELDTIGFRCVSSEVVRSAPDDTCEVRYQKALILLEHERAALEQGHAGYALQLLSDALDLVSLCISNERWEPVTLSLSQAETVEMVEVPAGCFTMGRDDGAVDELPAHQICFGQEFWIDKTEVTRDMYATCVAAGACTYIEPTAESQFGQQPQNHVTWFQARDYCAWRGARLPTEAEWEYAAAGPDSWLYPWGEGFGVRQAVYNSRDDGTANVGSIPSGRSWVGALDMSGNVGEWVSSIYYAYPYAADDGRENPDDTTSPRVWRGGSYYDFDQARLMTVTRQSSAPTYQSQNHGFRCASSEAE